MAQALIAIGTNLGDRLTHMRTAAESLSKITDRPLRQSSIWKSEPIGPAIYPFLNAAALIETRLAPHDLLSTLKRIEQEAGRRDDGPRWGPRVLDLDIITYDNLVIETETLILPHPEYSRRLFVLLPMQEILPEWSDPATNLSLAELIRQAPEIGIERSGQTW